MLQEDKITIPLLPIKRTPAIEGWKFSHPCKCTRRRNNNPLRQRFIFGVRLWEEQHGVVVEGGGETEYKGVCSHVHNIHIFLGKSPQLSIRLFILKKKRFLSEFKLQAFIPQVLLATVIYPVCERGTKNMAMAKKNVFRALTN